jgi:hypothetical protein
MTTPKLNIDLQKLAQQLIPHFLKGVGASLAWQTAGGLNWLTAAGTSWMSAGGSGRHRDWIAAILAPLVSLNQVLVTYAESVYYRLSITGQVIYLEHYLNDLFDADDRRIYIADNSLILPPYLYQRRGRVIDWPLYLAGQNAPTVYLYNQVDFLNQGSFIVMVPSQITLTTSTQNRIRSAVNRYKQAGVYYTIESF